MRGNSGKEQATCFLGGIMDHDATADAKEEAKQKMDDISLGIEEQLHIKGVADKINKYMTGKKTLIVFQDDRDCISPWEDTRNALSLINCSSGIECSDGDHKQEPEAKEFCCPPGEPITYSLVGLYNDIILQLATEKRKRDGSYDPQILHGILEKCDSTRIRHEDLRA